MNPEQALLQFVEGIGNTDFSIIITLIQLAFVAFWIVVLGWVWVDASERTTNFFMKLMAVILVAVLNILGLIIYLLLRPKQTIQELYWADLERRYLKYETAELGDCKNCKFSLQPGFNICPKCGVQLKKQCANCHVWVDKSYTYCPFCTSTVGTPVVRREVVAPVVPEKMEEAVNKSKEEAIKVVEGNKTKYVDRQGVLSKVKGEVTSFLKKVGDAALARQRANKAKKEAAALAKKTAVVVPAKVEKKKKDKKHKKRK